MVKNPPAMQEAGFDPLVGKIPLEEALATTSVFLPGKAHGQGSLEDYSLEGHKESDLT